MISVTVDLKDSAASMLKDPFNTSSMVKLSTYCAPNLFDRQWEYRGTIGFQNGNTVGEQKFKAESLSALLTKMQAFVETLETLK